MAKLSAHGYELARIEITRENPEPRDQYDTVTAYTLTYSVRSDGHIMQKRKAHGLHQSSADRYGGSPDYTWGWKLWRKTKSRKLPAEEIIRIAGRLFSRAIVHDGAKLTGMYAANVRAHAEEKQSAITA